VSALLGLVVAFSVPLWQALFVNAPKLSVEITAITRMISDAVVVPVDDDPELIALRVWLPKAIRDTLAEDVFRLYQEEEQSSRSAPTLPKHEERLLRAKQPLKDLPAGALWPVASVPIRRYRTLSAERRGSSGTTCFYSNFQVLSNVGIWRTVLNLRSPEVRR
jgi:hypothetical protein